MVVGRLLSYWEGNFSGAMLNFGRVNAWNGKNIKVVGVGPLMTEGGGKTCTRSVGHKVCTSFIRWNKLFYNEAQLNDDIYIYIVYGM